MKKYRFVIIIALLLCAAGAGASSWYLLSNRPADTPSNATKNLTLADASNKPDEATFDNTKFSTSDPSSIWVVVNKQHPLSPIDYAPSDLTSVGNGQFMRAEAAGALATMLNDARLAGHIVTAASAYRSYPIQVTVYDNEVKTYGKTVADSESARPGYSEHQTGLAVDFASDGCSITDCFGATPGGKWIAANAYKYGFLLRYTPSDSTVTGYRSESWHYRYIGVDLSTEFHDQNIATLESFFGITGGSSY